MSGGRGYPRTVMIAAPGLIPALTALWLIQAPAGPAAGNPPSLPLALPPSSPLRLQAGVRGELELWRGSSRLGPVALTSAPGVREPARLREVRVQGHEVVEVRVPLKPERKSGSGPRVELWVGAIETGAVRRLHGEVLGPRDADGETRSEAAVEPEGIYLFQTAARLAGCGGSPLRLFARRYDFTSNRFVPAPAAPAPAATTLQARRDAPELPTGRPRVQFPFAASTALPIEDTGKEAEQDARRLLAPTPLNDGDPNTVWTSRGALGETLVARAASAGHQVIGLRLLPGDTRSRGRSQSGARPRVIQLELGPSADQRFDVHLDPVIAGGPDGHRRPLWIALPRPVATACLAIHVREVTPGNDPRAGGALVWGDLEIFTDLDGQGGGTRLVQTLERPDCESRVGDVVALGIEALPALASLLERTRDSSRDCVLEALGRLELGTAGASKAGQDLGQGLSRGLIGATASQEQQLLALMRRWNPPPVASVAALLQDGQAAEQDRARAVRALVALARREPDATSGAPRGDAGEPAKPVIEVQQVLLAAAGRGPAPVRTAVRQALGAPEVGEVTALVAALQATPPAETDRRADLTLALGLRLAGRRPMDPPDHNHPGAAILVALAEAEQEPFAVRARAVEGLGRLASEAALQALDRLRSRSKDPVLRRLATRALASRRHPGLAGSMRAALNDDDPEVRELAAAALAALGDRQATPLLIAGAKQEPWPAVRRAEVVALGQLCGPGATDLLARAVERDGDDVRRAALAGLVSCKDGRAVDTLLAVLKRERESATLRTFAAGQLARAGDRRATVEMAEALAGMAALAETDLALEGAAVATLRALGTLGGPAAVKAALQHAADPRPSLRRTAIEALGRLCDASATAALTAATRDQDPGVATAAAAGLRRCAGSAGRSGARPNLE